MVRHLSERYGPIDEHFLINYEIEQILARVGMTPRVNEGESLALKNLTSDQTEEALARAAQNSHP